jgi:hypothetical protein
MSNPKPPVVDSTKSIPEMMEFFWTYFTTITKDESDYIETILHWTQEMKAAFVMSKRIFEEKSLKDMQAALADKNEVS